MSIRMLIGDVPCWPWHRRIGPNGYGYWGKQLAHRRMYELLVGPIPAGLDLDHLCRNTKCVNPAHLEPVTHAENVRRGMAGKVNAERQLSKTHCRNGHPYDAEKPVARARLSPLSGVRTSGDEALYRAEEGPG